jgi:nucleoside-diphosphate-sugar epimerase
MKIVVTGAAGHLGSHLVSALRDANFDVVGIDRLAPAVSPEYPFIAADLVSQDNEERVLEALHGAHCIAHCASIHPWKEYTDDEYLDANVKGTWKLYSLAERAGVSKVVLTSSIVACGVNIPSGDWPVREEKEYTLNDLYSFTKHAQEDIARHFAAIKNIQTIALRPPAFMPKPELETGFLLTGNFAIVSDVASAHLAAVEVLCGRRESSVPLKPFEAIFTTTALPYSAEDATAFEHDGIKSLVNKYWPHAQDWLLERGYESGWLIAVYDLAKAQRVLGWQPSYNFEQWFEEHAGDN